MNLSSLAWLREGGFDLLVESYSNTALTVQVRGYTENELVIHDHSTSSDRSLTSSVISITGSPLYLTARSATTGIKRGQCYVRVSLRIEGVIVATLFAGYVDDTSAVAFPNGTIEDSKSGVGYIRSITGTDPAAGVQISETVPTGALWHPISVKFTIVCDATVVSRGIILAFTDGTNELMRSFTNTTVPAGTTLTATFSDIGTVATGLSNANMGVFSDATLLPAGFQITTVINNLQAGDNLGAPQLLVEEWINP